MDTIVIREQLKWLIERKEKYILIDVRQKEELAYGMIPTAHNIPLQEFEEAWDLAPETFEQRYNFKKPSKEDLVIFYCRTGGRSAQATAYAQSKGYKSAKNFRGSVKEWSEIDPNVQMYQQ